MRKNGHEQRDRWLKKSWPKKNGHVEEWPWTKAHGEAVDRRENGLLDEILQLEKIENNLEKMKRSNQQPSPERAPLPVESMGFLAEEELDERNHRGSYPRTVKMRLPEKLQDLHSTVRK